MKLEGHYTIKRIDRLPTKGNQNFLYTLVEDKISKFFIYLPDGSYKELAVGSDSADGSETIINSGTNITVTGSGTSADPYVINGSGGTDTSLALNADNTNLDHTNQSGVVTQVDLSNLVSNLETNTSLVANADNTNLDFTNETGVTSQINLSSIVSNLQTTTSLSLATDTLTFTDETGANTAIDLSPYSTDTSVTSGVVSAAAIATFTKSDTSTFDVDFTPMLPGTPPLDDVLVAGNLAPTRSMQIGSLATVNSGGNFTAMNNGGFIIFRSGGYRTDLADAYWRGSSGATQFNVTLPKSDIQSGGASQTTSFRFLSGVVALNPLDVTGDVDFDKEVRFDTTSQLIGYIDIPDTGWVDNTANLTAGDTATSLDIRVKKNKGYIDAVDLSSTVAPAPGGSHTIFTLPAAHIPNRQQHFSFNGSNGLPKFGSILTNGDVVVYNQAAGTNSFLIEYIIDRDNI